MGIEFLCRDDEPGGRLCFVVADAVTGETVEDWSASQFRLVASEGTGVLLHAGPLDLDDVAEYGPLEWIVEADGYAPAFGDERAFDRDPATGVRTARVSLERGFATRLVVLGSAGERVPAADATVRVDGAPAGRTGLDGALVLRSGARPSHLEVRWGAQGASGPFDEVCLRRRSHLHVVLLGEGAGR